MTGVTALLLPVTTSQTVLARRVIDTFRSRSSPSATSVADEPRNPVHSSFGPSDQLEQGNPVSFPTRIALVTARSVRCGVGAPPMPVPRAWSQWIARRSEHRAGASGDEPGPSTRVDEPPAAVAARSHPAGRARTLAVLRSPPGALRQSRFHRHRATRESDERNACGNDISPRALHKVHTIESSMTYLQERCSSSLCLLVRVGAHRGGAGEIDGLPQTQLS